MNLNQAPKGGAISPVNREFYEGGRFMPDTGMFCGTRKRAMKHADTPGNWVSVTVRRGVGGYWVVALPVGKRETYLEKKPFNTSEEATAYAEAVLQHRADATTARGFVPHPTELLFESVAG